MSRAAAKLGKQSRRAREDLERGLRRHNLALGLEGFIGIPDAEAAAPDLAAGRSWLARELGTALAARADAALEPWFKVGAGLPALLTRLQRDDEETRWALLWAAVGAGRWNVAELMLATLESRLRERAPELARAMAELVARRGALALEHIPEPLRAPASDPRFGVEAVRPRARRSIGPVPATAAEVERELIECYATEPFSHFSALALRWLRDTPREPAFALAVTAAELACSELLRSIEGDQDSRNFSAVELVLAALASVEPPSSADRERCDRALLLALRVVLGALGKPEALRPHAGLVASAVQTALATPALRDSTILTITELAGREANALPAALLCAVHGQSPTAPLWVRAVLALDAEEEHRFKHGRRPRRSSAEWIERGLAVHLSDPGDLERCIASLPPKQRQELLTVLGLTVGPVLVGDLFLALWPAADDVRRRDLASFAYAALDASTNVFYCAECDEPHTNPLRSFADLSSPGRALYDRVSPALVASDERFLALALDRELKRNERRALLLSFVHDGAPIDHHVSAIELARRFGLPQKPFRDKLRARFAGRVVPLARGLDLAAGKLGVRSSAVRELAEALSDAVASTPAAERSAHVLRQLRLARRITARSRRKRTGSVPPHVAESTS